MRRAELWWASRLRGPLESRGVGSEVVFINGIREARKRRLGPSQDSEDVYQRGGVFVLLPVGIFVVFRGPRDWNLRGDLGPVHSLCRDTVALEGE